MFVGSGDASVPPQFPDGLSKGRNHALQQCLPAQLRRFPLERGLERAGVERLHEGNALIQN
jgi:hypothetical protein